MTKESSNVGAASSVHLGDVEFSNDADAVCKLPSSLRHFVLFEAQAPYDVLEIVQAVNDNVVYNYSTYEVEWRRVEAKVRSFDRELYLQSYPELRGQLTGAPPCARVR